MWEENRHGNLGTYGRDGDGDNFLLEQVAQPLARLYPGWRSAGAWACRYTAVLSTGP